MITFLIRLALGKINLQHVELEIESQFKQFKRLGLSATYLDSEQHTHIFIPIWNTVIKQAKKHRIKMIRSPHSSYNYLKRKPLKFLTVVFFQSLFLLRYGWPKKYPTYHALIVHPGTNFDQTWH